MCFVQVARPEINTEFPTMKFAEIAKTLGERWKGMAAELRGGYEKLAEQDKDRYQVSVFRRERFTSNVYWRALW